MSTKKHHQTLQYTYSHSFRQIYQQNIPSQSTPNQHSPFPNNIFIQYQKTKTSHKKLTVQPKVNPTKHQTPINDNPIKRLHTSNKKYSFSIFVKKCKKQQNQRKHKTQSLQETNRPTTEQKRIKGTRQINSVIRTIYDNFRKFQNMSKRSQVSKSSRTSSLTEPKQQTSFAQQTIRQTARQSTKISLNHSPSYHDKSASLQQNPTSRTRINFIKTLSFGQKLQHSRQLQNFRAHDQSRGYLTIGRQDVPLLGYQQTQYDTNCFLRIEKCSLQKKDQTFMKTTIDFRDTMLKDRLMKENKKKAIEIMNALANDTNQFLKYAETVRENKYVGEMRGAKKTKKKWPKEKEEDNSRNKISPW